MPRLPELAPAASEQLHLGWQSGVERLGYLYRLPEPVQMVELVPLIAALAAEVHGADPPAPGPARSSYHDTNLTRVRAASADELVFELGCVLGEAVRARHGWEWVHGSTPGRWLQVDPEQRYRFDPFDVVEYALLSVAPASVLKRFAALEQLEPADVGALRWV